MKPPSVKITPPEHEGDRYRIVIHTEALSGLPDTEVDVDALIRRAAHVNTFLDNIDLAIDRATFDALRAALAVPQQALEGVEK